ncbi:hypothetical protein HCN44_000315 [Aphidius gifuensis]|uniref:Uncharacterized protein n=1 Tax=Aphidius gifuensis TaxID=684658 RepID=A0A834XNQ7_APHGI|nr:hypothetical protein HCN44_000315 [Aphidius gifuensis]
MQTKKNVKDNKKTTDELIPKQQQRNINIEATKKSLITHIPAAAHLQKLQTTIVKEAGRLNIFPHIVAIGGKTIDQSTEFCVLLYDRKFKMLSATEAIDFCFKIFYVLQVQYPPASKYIWKLLQKGLYKLDDEQGVNDVIPYMSKIYAFLKKENSKNNELSENENEDKEKENNDEEEEDVDEENDEQI